MQQYVGKADVGQQLADNLDRIRRNAHFSGKYDIAGPIDKYLRGPKNVKMSVRFLEEAYRSSFNSRDLVKQLFSGYQRISGHYPTHEFEHYIESIEPAILRDIKVK